MTPWDALWALLGYLGLLLAVLLTLMIIFLVLIGFWRGLKNVFRKQPPKADPTLYEDFIQEATVLGEGLYTNDPEGVARGAFRAGARWGWSRLHRVEPVRHSKSR